MVDAAGTRAGDDYSESLVVRLAPAAAGIFPEYDLAVQARAQEAAAAHGIPAAVAGRARDRSAVARRAVPRDAGDRRARPGLDAGRTTAWIMDRVDGRARMSRAGSTTSSPRSTRSTGAPRGLDAVIPVRDLDAELAYWTRYLDWYGDGEVLAPGADRSTGVVRRAPARATTRRPRSSGATCGSATSSSTRTAAWSRCSTGR